MSLRYYLLGRGGSSSTRQMIIEVETYEIFHDMIMKLLELDRGDDYGDYEEDSANTLMGLSNKNIRSFTKKVWETPRISIDTPWILPWRHDVCVACDPVCESCEKQQLQPHMAIGICNIDQHGDMVDATWKFLLGSYNSIQLHKVIHEKNSCPWKKSGPFLWEKGLSITNLRDYNGFKLGENFVSWTTLRYRAIVRSKGCCEACGQSGELHVDHIKPRSKYPELASELKNLQVLCRACNLGKGTWDQTDWRESELQQLVSQPRPLTTNRR